MHIKMCLLLLLPAAAGQLQGTYVILLFVFNTVCYGYLRHTFVDFVHSYGATRGVCFITREEITQDLLHDLQEWFLTQLYMLASGIMS